jgi:sn1-specific diacylglycerol lipase
MPALVLFKRRTLVAGDDLCMYAGVSITVRLAQLAFAIALTIRASRQIENYLNQSALLRGDLECLALEEANTWRTTVYAYTSSSIALCVVGLCIEVLVWIFSGRGTPTQTEERSPLKCICHINLTFLMLLKIGVLLVGTRSVQLCRKYCECSPDVNECRKDTIQLYLALLYMQSVDIGFNVVAALYFGCKWLPRCPRSVRSETKWMICCRCCCTLSSCLTCCLLGGRETIMGDFSDVAVLLSDFFDFHGTLDLVLSDIVAGLLMVKRVQQQFREECRQLLLERVEELRLLSETARDHEVGETEIDITAEQVLTSASTTLSGVNFRLKRHMGSHCCWEPSISEVLVDDELDDQIAIAEGARFMRLSWAIYTWVMYALKRPLTGLCEISYLSAQLLCEKESTVFQGDSKFCRLHAAAFMKESGLEETEIAYAQFRCAVDGHTPYAIVIDHDWQSIVIVIRGSESLEDVLTSLTIRPTSLEEVGNLCGFDGSDLYAHSGMLTSTIWIYNDIQAKGVLDNLLLDEQSKFANYRLRITGHSLGAGCAAILSLMLRPKHPNLRAHCFCPPGCTLSETAAIECEEFLTSYVNNDDIIPRLSVNSMENLRFDVVEMIARVKVPKVNVVWCYSKKYGKLSSKVAHSQVLYDEHEIPDSVFKQQWEKYHQLYEERKIQRDFPDIQLFPPGRLLHIVKVSSEEPKSLLWRLFRRPCLHLVNEERYVSRWATRLDFSEIRISPNCMWDHDGVPLLERLELEFRRLKAQPQYVDHTGISTR